MFKAAPLSSLLSQTLSNDIDCAILFTRSGALLAHASVPSDARRARVIASLAASVYLAADTLDDSLANARKGEDWVSVQMNNGRLFVQDVRVTRTDLGVVSDGLLLGVQGAQDTPYGFLRIQARRVKDHLESEMTRL